MKRLVLLFLLAGIIYMQRPVAACAQELTIQSIYAEGGLTGRGPDTIKWSPDGRKVSYILHQERSEKADLYYIDITTGKPHPEPYLKGASDLGFSATDCVVIEDVPAGIRAGSERRHHRWHLRRVFLEASSQGLWR